MIDARRVREYLDLAREQVGLPAVRSLARAAGEKSRALRRLPGAGIGPAEAAAALELVFPAARTLRRRGQEAAAALAPAIRRLLQGGADAGAVGARLDRFCEEAGPVLGRAAADVAADLLHFVRPESCWLWARWVWDPWEGTGVLPVLGHAPAAGADTPAGETYLRVGEALANLQALLGPDLVQLGPQPFGLDAYLAVVFGLHAYLVASVRTTEEFASILPRPLEMAGRLLGVRRWLDEAVGGEAEDEKAAAAAATTVSPAGEGGIR